MVELKNFGKEKVSILSIFANLFLALIKVAGGIFSKSSSVLAEGLHSSVDVFSSLISYFSVRMGQKPPDKKHPYGHQKFEVVGSILIIVILILTGLFIIYGGIKSLLNPSHIVEDTVALIIMFISTLVNYGMSKLKIYYGKKENSLSLLSDGIHSKVDVWTSLIVFVGLILDKFFIYTDGLLTIFIGLYIMKESFELGKESVDSLLDSSAGEEVENKIKEFVEKKNKIKVLDLKTLKRGSYISVNLKIALPNDLSVEEVSKISNKLRAGIMEEIENVNYVAIQVESYDFSHNYYIPKSDILGIPIGRGFGWRRKLLLSGNLDEKELNEIKKNLKDDFYCVCEKCGYKIKHKRGIPCTSMKCPKCGTKLSREDISQIKNNKQKKISKK